MNAFHDLGPLKGPVVLFGGPYSNLAATRAVLDAAATHGIPPGRMICTGDVVAYCAEAAETVALVRAAGIHVVMGNCEESLGAGAADCGCGFDADSACNRLSAQWYAHADRALDDGARAWMRGLPRRLRFTLAGAVVDVIHGGAGAINRFVFVSTPAAEKAADLDRLGGDAVVGGHCGLPFADPLADGRLWLNAGVVGMPANDGTPRGWYMVLAARRDGALDVTFHPLDYDHAGAVRAMAARGLPAEYARALATGLWPNMDVLPAAERAQRGRPLSPAGLTWRPPRPAKIPQIA
ncbi:MAG: metallophosphoesterase family protein [Hyphomicrobiales bacterium]|nr:metallophosphoesterase family protein [Hyphomicrobiales bacterium]MCP5371887.1 metallophosphoesterase family protein [Hyphomicrobiales bacterium]